MVGARIQRYHGVDLAQINDVRLRIFSRLIGTEIDGVVLVFFILALRDIGGREFIRFKHLPDQP